MELDLVRISGKCFSFNWIDQSGPVSVEVTIPNLRGIEHSVWGDWGPMYTFRLNESHAIKLKYNGQVTKSRQSSLPINSPMLNKERERYPYYLEVEAREWNVKFKIYIDNEYELGKIEVICLRNKIKIFEKIEDHLDYRNWNSSRRLEAQVNAHT